MEADFDDENAPVFGENPFASSNRRPSIPTSEPASPTARNLSIFTDDQNLPSVGAGSSRPSVIASPFFTTPPANQLTSNLSQQSLQDDGRDFSIPDYNQTRKASYVSALSGTRSPMTQEEEEQDARSSECDVPHSPFTMHEDCTSPESKPTIEAKANSAKSGQMSESAPMPFSHPRLSMLQKQGSGLDRRSSSVYSRYQDDILDLYMNMSPSGPSPGTDSQSTSPGDRASWLTSSSIQELLRPDVYEPPPPVPAIPAPYAHAVSSKKDGSETMKLESKVPMPAKVKGQEKPGSPSSSDTSAVTRQLLSNIPGNINQVFDYEMLPKGPPSRDELASPVGRALEHDIKPSSETARSKVEPIPSPALSSSNSSFRHQRNFSRPHIYLGGKQSPSPQIVSSSVSLISQVAAATSGKDGNKAPIEPPTHLFRPQLDTIPSEEDQTPRRSQQSQRAESRSRSDSTGRHSTGFQIGSTLGATSTVPSTEPSPTQETHPVDHAKRAKVEDVRHSIDSHVRDHEHPQSPALFPPVRPAALDAPPPTRQNFDFNKAVSYVKDHLPDLPDGPSGLVSQHFVEKKKESWISRRLKNIDRLMLKSTEYKDPPPKQAQMYAPMIPPPQTTRPHIVHIPDPRIADERTKLGNLVDLAPQEQYLERKKSSPSLLRRLSQKLKSKRSSKSSTQGNLISPSVHGSQQVSPYGAPLPHEHSHHDPRMRYSTYRSENQHIGTTDAVYVRVPRDDFYRQHHHTRSNDTGVLLRNGRADAYPRQVAFARPISTYSGSQPFTPIEAGNPYQKSLQESVPCQTCDDRFLSSETLDSYDRYGPPRSASAGPHRHQPHIVVPRPESHVRHPRMYAPFRPYDVVEYGNPEPDPVYGGAYAVYEQPRLVYVRPESQVFRHEPSLRRTVYDDVPRGPRHGWEEGGRSQQRWV